MSIFMSHASRDTGLPLYDVLLEDLRKRSGHEVWVDSELAGGQLWWDEICRQIRACSLFIVVVTPQLKKSQACDLEFGYAMELGKALLPVKITAMADWAMPNHLAQVQVLDYSSRRDPGDAGVECAFALSGAVSSLVRDGDPLPDPLPDQPPVPDSYLSDLQRYLQAPELTLKDQEQFLVSVRIHLEDADRRPAELSGLITAFLARPDVVHRVHAELDRCLTALGTDDATDEAPHTQNVPRSVPSPRADVPAAGEPVPPGYDLAVTEPVAAASPDQGWTRTAPTGLKTARLPAPGVDVGRLADTVKGWFESQKLEAQVHAEGGRVLVQCRSSSLARKVGAGSALSVLLGTDRDQLVVEIGGGKWADKMAAAGVGALIAWPVLIPAAMGGYKQATLPRRTISYIESMIPRCSS